jgi:hypothetical protein
MGWIESHEEIGDHHKTHKLAELLNCNVPTAVGTVHLLWHYTLKVSWQFGDLSKQSAYAIARGCWFDGDPNELLTAFQQSGFLDGLKVHDWDIYAKQLIYQRLYNSSRKDKKDIPVVTAVDTAVVKASTKPNLTKPNHNKSVVSQEDFIKELKKTYTHLDIERELAKIDGWLLANPYRKKTKRFIINWLNRADVTIENNASQQLKGISRSEYLDLINNK